MQAPPYPPAAGPQSFPDGLSRHRRIMDGMTDAIESTLPPYTADRPRCSKCGHNTASTHYTSEGEPCGRLTRLTAVDVGERLCRTCERCSYHWDEALATNDQTAPFRDRALLGQQFKTDFVYSHTGETHLILTHTPSGLHHTMAYPQTRMAGDAERVVVMVQALLDQVDEWQRQPIESPTSDGETA